MNNYWLYIYFLWLFLLVKISIYACNFWYSYTFYNLLIISIVPHLENRAKKKIIFYFKRIFYKKVI